ncbi:MULTISPECIES: phenylalanine--tRNA ligase subunit beta [Sphingobacterium]|uniref:Phenylalanine--tRNA ligase beta subunit n=1 Tax=Sphingobacterium populi TaxID=1812824 RepID=A0ABW5UAT0_9SPHI|nr:phenylalanine--tRNA ligase subunit beta [Sphingobacterium sp. CFCC 11742]
MKISYNWLKNFIDIAPYTPDELSLILTDIGLEVEAVDKVQSIPGGLEGLLVGEVLTCDRHPNADKLQITTVNVGAAEPLHIVCGAPNCRAGLKVIVAPPGAVCHPSSGEPFKITKSKIRGEVSEGMLCGEDEVGLGTSHAGIVELPEGTVPGLLVKDFYQMEDDFCFEIGLTPNRADAASHLGVARDLAAYFRKELQPINTESVTESQVEGTAVVVLATEDAPRYAGINISGITVAESPSWLKEKLQTIGVRPINNVVDVTNYILHDLGQPLHAFDQAKIAGNKIVVRKAKEGELFVTLDEVERKLTSEDLVIADAEKPMCIAGVFGGAESGVTETTTDVFLESAYFHPVTVRKTAKRHGLKTDSSFRFERGTDPNMPVIALKKAAALIQEVAGGQVSSEITDLYPAPVEAFRFEVAYNHVQRLIGKEIPKEEIREIIQSLGIGIEHETEEALEVAVPPFKVDVTREVDVIEEVLRIYGYNNIELGTQIKASLNTVQKPDREVILNQVADLLIGNGYREILSNSLSKEAYAENVDTAVKLLNPLSTDLDTMRQNLLFSALTAVSYNQKRKSADLKLFEFGKSYHLVDDKYQEKHHLAIAITGRQAVEQWNHAAASVNFYDIKAVVDGILKRLRIDGIRVEDNKSLYFNYGLTYKKGEKILVEFGEVSKANLKKADVERSVFFAQFDWDAVLKMIKKQTIKFQDISKFPAVRRDLALLLDEKVSFEQLRLLAQKTERKLLKEVAIFDVYKGDKLPVGKKSYALSFTLQDENQTLTDKQIDGVIQKLITNFEKEVGAEVR